MKLAKLKFSIAYDGRPFCGWQSQAEGGSVQDHLEAAFTKLVGSSTRVGIHGSGRTDAGVHALGQVAHVEVPKERFTPQQWCKALNANLPYEIRVTRCSWAAPDFHARFSAKGKIYRYRLYSAPVFPPLEIGRAWHVFTPIDFDVLKQCAKGLLGTHDFAAFAANRGKGSSDDDTIRTIRRIDITRKPGGLIEMTFEGDGFLYRMVRLLVGSLIRCAQGKATPDWLFGLLNPPSRPVTKTNFAAPAEGLYLVKVLY